MDENNQTESGFTLLEVLVALVIMIMGLAAYYFAFGSGLLAGESSERSVRNVQIASNLIAQLGHSIPLEDGGTTGELPDGRRWRLRLEPFSARESQDAAPPLVAHIVTLDLLSSSEGDTLRVKTLVVGVKP
jgi:general secretion pathway protein I